MLKGLQSMAKIENELYIFLLSAIGMLGMIIMICMGYDGNLIKAFIGANALGIGYLPIKKVAGRLTGGKSNGKEKEDS